MRFLKYGLVGLAVYLLFLLVTLPMAWVWKLAPVPSGVELNGLQGSVWKGQAAQLKVADRTLEQLSWELYPSRLLMGQAALSFRVDGTDVQGQGDVRYGLGGLDAEGLRFSAPIGWLVGDARLPLRTQLAGNVTLNLSRLEQGEPWCEQLNGRLLVDALDVRNQFGHYPLGNMAGSLGCQQGNVQLLLDGAENQIGVEGQALLLANNQVEVDALIRETDNQPQDLRQALQFLGKPNADGAYPITYNGALPGL
ncbi:type II secretion system protein N [Ferrimonas marina]|uniref:Type II secretion system protein N n=1 Tax=Ferrimonas marina TaxID=299255 RepID=A0A1M5Z8R6_9GAMM|nr:type II secretion system protein N [Ferrimonas marina]SHI20584.1 type II secretion system protein N (GspN) [Ferrimonas marina]